MKYEIKHARTGAVLFTADIEADEDTPESMKLRRAVVWALKNKTSLTNADLRGADLSGESLRGIDLSMSKTNPLAIHPPFLAHSNFFGADLTGACLIGANLRGADLRDAKLDGADMRGTFLHQTNLSGVDLSVANLDGAKLPSKTK